MFIILFYWLVEKKTRQNAPGDKLGPVSARVADVAVHAGDVSSGHHKSR